MNRYTVTGPEGEHQPGSNDQVLRNKLGLTRADDINEAELVLLSQLYDHVLGITRRDQRLTVAMIKEWHRQWLGNLYTWAGAERSVNISKDGFPFPPTSQISRLLADFDQHCLARLTPCYGMSLQQAVAAIAEVHVELILIHPFREGNGRLARLVADAMAFQAGIGPLDYSPWNNRRDSYIAAIQTGLDRNYAPMQALVRQAAR